MSHLISSLIVCIVLFRCIKDHTSTKIIDMTIDVQTMCNIIKHTLSKYMKFNVIVFIFCICENVNV